MVFPLGEEKYFVRDKNLSPLFFRALSFEATYFEDTFPAYFEGLLRALFSSLLSCNFLKCSRGSDEVTHRPHQGHLHVVVEDTVTSGSLCPSTPVAGTLVDGTMSGPDLYLALW